MGVTDVQGVRSAPRVFRRSTVSCDGGFRVNVSWPIWVLAHSPSGLSDTSSQSVSIRSWVGSGFSKYCPAQEVMVGAHCHATVQPTGIPSPDGGVVFVDTLKAALRRAGELPGANGKPLLKGSGPSLLCYFVRIA